MIKLNSKEIRILGVLFEKERTTPDQYPLSLNALTNGCNQKSNREPVTDLSESEVQQSLDDLTEKGHVTEVVVGSRVRKYRQRFGNTEFSELKLTKKEQALICVLFLRGAQTAGELRTRTNRLCEFNNVQDVEQVLQEIIDGDRDVYIAKLPREPGKRESRYIHLFGDVSVDVDKNDSTPSVNTVQDELIGTDNQRISALEQQVQSMQRDIDELKSLWRDLNS